MRLTIRHVLEFGTLKQVGFSGGVVVFLVLFAACGETPTEPSDVLARREKPGSGGSTINPIQLANPKSFGCSLSPYAISSVGPVHVVGQAVCAGKPRPFEWIEGVGARLMDPALEGTAEGVADDGTSVGWLTRDGPPAFIRSPGGVLASLPLPSGATYGTATDITPDGSIVVGGSEGKSLRWFRDAGGAWQVTVLSSGGATAVSDDGTIVVGSFGGNPAVWMRSAGGAWSAQVLLAGGGVARGIDGSGSVIAGFRYLPLPKDPERSYPEHVVWTRDANEATGWRLEPLGGLGVNEGVANGVAIVNGATVVVGFTWEDTSGPGGTPWAVYWRRGPGDLQFGPALKLQPLSTTKWGGAMAQAVNTRGEIVGTAYSASVSTGTTPVMWKLP